MLTLHHGGADGASLRLMIALEELDLRYETVPVDLARMAHWAPAHLRIAQDGAVPVLIDDALVMTDSGIALLYLAEKYPAGGLLCDDPAGRYQAQALIDTLDAAFLDSVNLLGWHRSTGREERERFLGALAALPGRSKPAGWSAVWSDAEDDLIARARQKIIDGLVLTERVLADHDWVAGGSYGVADISTYALARTLPALLDDEQLPKRFPNFCAWHRRISARPAIGRALSRATAVGPDHAPPR